jgi:hypothetical protein
MKYKVKFRRMKEEALWKSVSIYNLTVHLKKCAYIRGR